MATRKRKAVAITGRKNPRRRLGPVNRLKRALSIRGLSEPEDYEIEPDGELYVFRFPGFGYKVLVSGDDQHEYEITLPNGEQQHTEDPDAVAAIVIGRKNPKKLKVTNRSRGGPMGRPVSTADFGPFYLIIAWVAGSPHATPLRAFCKAVAKETGGEPGPPFALALPSGTETNGDGIAFVYHNYEAACEVADHIKDEAGDLVMTMVIRVPQEEA